MPITKSAKKALRRDRRRAKINLRHKRRSKVAIKNFQKKPSLKKLSLAYSSLDRAAKKKVIHKRKSARLKSKLAKLLKTS